MKVYIKITDIDRHGEGHWCGLCNANGKSYQATAYDYLDDKDVYSEYASSEDAAEHNVAFEMRRRGHQVLD